MPNVATSLAKFYDVLDSFRLTVEFDPEWTSPCVAAGHTAEETVEWHAVPMNSAPDFAEIEAQLGTKIHPRRKSVLWQFLVWTY